MLQNMMITPFNTVLLKRDNNSRLLETDSGNKKESGWSKGSHSEDGPEDLILKYVKPTKPKKMEPEHAGGTIPGDGPTVEDFYSITKHGATKFKGT